ncbi:hypothetical protein ONZ43_g1746 [Nemania bipapillata]|uniref:Uncharacterized protein n=1 Tax=Nemania bipapillata TaxID=110536 RepID=A0ACC2J367_9PEZI|nr:hypothetical protein ONZ43_g1746 [Nemania bipapillata]
MSQKFAADPTIRPLESAGSSFDGSRRRTMPALRQKSDYAAVVANIFAISAGVAFAVGHDRYNSYLNGKQVDQISVSQDWITRIGTAFAWLVKTGLTTAVATAYVQRLWTNLRTRSFEVQHVDTLMEAPNNAFAFLDPRPWIRVPELLVMGAAIWIIPLAAVISPGTLTVVYSPVSQVQSLTVPQLSYNSSTWASIGPVSSDMQFWGASADVQRTGFAAATTGEIVGLPYQYLNESYHLDLSGPAIQCSTANDTVRNATQYNIKSNWGSGGFFGYWAWVGNDDHGITSNNFSSSSSNLQTDGTWLTIDTNSDDAARFFVVSSLGATHGNQAFFGNVSECLLYNASYSVDVNITNGASLVAIKSLTMNEKLPGQGRSSSGLGLTDAERTHYSYQSVMDAFGKLLVGYGYTQNGVTETTYSSFLRTYVDWTTLEQTQSDLESLFQNMTLSMLSASNLLLNSTQASQVPVTITTYPLIYLYQPKDLWIAYGVSIGVTLIATLVGLQSFFVNGAGYSSKFSTSAKFQSN